MSRRLPLQAAVLALALGAAAPAPAAPPIVRCTAADGHVSYQHAPCAAAATETHPAIPSAYPEPDVAARARLFEREAALYRRLEARRDRELQEAQLREARAEREAERERQAALLAAAAQPQFILAHPLRPWGAQHPRRARHWVRR